MLIKQEHPFKNGYNKIISLEEHNDALMDFGILRLGKDQSETNIERKERVYLLIQGEVTFEWDGKSVTAKRASFMDENPWCLSVSGNVEVKITGVAENSELCVSKTENTETFPSVFYSNKDCRTEVRGKGVMRDAAERVVRTVFDYTNAPESKFVIGEVIGYPGKWSSYPPHNHPQPEVYFYKFYPEEGYGHSEIGDDVVKIHTNDTVKLVEGVVHPQTSAPGYAMYLIWIIRHLDGEPYLQPYFLPEYSWISEPGAKYWPEK